MCGGYNSCRKVKCIWSSHFPNVINTNMMIGNDYFVFKYPGTCKHKISKKLYIFIEIKVTVWLFCANPLMTSIIFHNRRPNWIKLQLRTWFLCLSWCSFFAFWGAEKYVFHIAPFRSTRYVLKIFRCWRWEIVHRSEIKSKTSFSCGRYFKYSNW